MPYNIELPGGRGTIADIPDDFPKDQIRDMIIDRYFSGPMFQPATAEEGVPPNRKPSPTMAEPIPTKPPSFTIPQEPPTAGEALRTLVTGPQLPRIPVQSTDTPLSATLKTVANTAIGAGEFAISPLGIVTAGTAPIVPAAVAGIFAGIMAKETGRQAGEIYENFQRMTPAEQSKAIVDLTATGLFTALPFSHALKPGPLLPEGVKPRLIREGLGGGIVEVPQTPLEQLAPLTAKVASEQGVIAPIVEVQGETPKILEPPAAPIPTPGPPVAPTIPEIQDSILRSIQKELEAKPNKTVADVIRLQRLNQDLAQRTQPTVPAVQPAIVPSPAPPLPTVQPAPGPAAPGEVAPVAIVAPPVVAPVPPEAPPAAPVATGPDLIGVGAAVPGEFKGGENETVVSNMFAAIDADRAAMGEPPMPPARTRDWDQDEKLAMAEMNRNPDWIPNLIRDVADKPRPLLSWEQAGMVFQKAKWKAEQNNALRRIAYAHDDLKTITDPAQRELRQAELDEARALEADWADKIREKESAVGRGGTGSEAGRTLQAQKMGVTDEMTLADATQQFESAAGRRATPSEISDLQKTVDELKAKNESYQKHMMEKEKQIADMEVQRVLEETKRAVEAEVAKSKGVSDYVLKVAEKWVDSWEKEAKVARKALAGKFLSPTPEDLLNLAKIARADIGRMGLDFAKWTDKMAKEIGEGVRPYLQGAWDKAQKIINAQVDRQPEKMRDPLRKKVTKTEQSPEQLRGEIVEKIGFKIDKIKAKEIEGEETSAVAGKWADLTPLVKQLAKQFWNDGIREVHPMIDALQGVLKEFLPEISRKETMDALSGKGKFWRANQEEVAKGVRDLSTQSRLISHQMDVEAKEPLPRTGFQPDPFSDAARREQQKLNELKRRFGVVVTDPQQQLASALKARKTYYEHRLSDLRAEIAAKEKFVKTKTPSPTDPALEVLKDEYEKVKEEHEAMFPKNPTVTPEQQLKMALAAAEKQQKEWAERLVNARRGIFDRKKAPGRKVTSAELEAIKAQNEAIRDEVQHLKDLDANYQEKLQADKIKKSTSEYERRLKDGEFETPPSQEKAETPALKALKVKRDAARDAFRKAKEGSPVEMAKAEAAAKAHGDELQRRINEGDIASKKAGTPKVSTPELGRQRAENAEMQKILQQMRNAAKPKKSAVEIALASRKAALTRKIADLSDRLARGDFAPAKRKVPVPLDPEGGRLMTQLEELKNRLERGKRAAELEQRSPAKKFVDRFITGSYNSLRSIAVMGHGTVGMFTHAGGLFWRASTAKIWWTNFLRQFPMWLKPAYHEQLIHRMITDPDFHTWRRAGAKIDPTGIYEDYAQYAKWLGKWAAGGQRGFDSLKLTRLELCKAQWEKVSPEIKADPEQAQAARHFIAELNNKATGTSTLFGQVDSVKITTAAHAIFFAPKLYASRWSRVVLDPIKTVATFAPGNRATPAERTIATIKLKHAVEFAAIYTSALAVNQGLLSATGSNQKVNFFDPSESDWLKFKVYGKIVTADGGLLDPIRLIGQIVYGDLIKSRTKKETFLKGNRFEAAVKDLGKYVRGKFNPSLGLVVDAATQQDFQGRALPFSEEPSKFKDQEPYTWGEFILSHGPIPLASGTRIIYETMQENGLSKPDAAALMEGAAAVSIGMTGMHETQDYKAR